MDNNKIKLIFEGYLNSSIPLSDKKTIHYKMNHEFDNWYEEKFKNQLLYCFYNNKEKYTIDEINDFCMLFEKDFFSECIKKPIREIRKLYLVKLVKPETIDKYIKHNLSKILFARIDEDYMGDLAEKIYRDIKESEIDKNEIIKTLYLIINNKNKILDNELNKIFKNVLKVLKGNFQKKL